MQKPFNLCFPLLLTNGKEYNYCSTFGIFFQRDDLEQDLKREIVEVRNQLASTEKTMIDDRRKERSSASEKDVLNDRLEENQSKLKSVLYENTLLSNRCDLLKAQLDESQTHIEHLSREVRWVCIF